MKTRCASAVLASLLLAAPWTAASEIAGLPLHVQRLAPGTIRLWLGDSISSTAVVAFATGKGIVVVDTFGVPSVDAELRRAITRELGRSDFALLINTHEHADHTGGNSVYGDLPIVGHERIGPALAAAAENRERLLAAYPLEDRFPDLAASPGFSPREHFATLAEMWTVVSGQRSAARALYDLIAAGADEAAVREILAARGKPASRYYFLEGELNRMGYAFLREGRAREAVRMLRLNTSIFPDSWNVYDSLGEALLATGDAAGAVAMYQRSLELNPESTSAREALTRIRGEGPTT